MSLPQGGILHDTSFSVVQCCTVWMLPTGEEYLLVADSFGSALSNQICYSIQIGFVPWLWYKC
jgi:hypothetical protein